MKNTTKIFLALLIAALSTLNFNVKAGCPHILVDGACISQFSMDFSSTISTHNVTVCVGATLTFDLVVSGGCANDSITTNVTGGYPPCASSFPGAFGPVPMNTITSAWTCTFNVPGMYQYVYCIIDSFCDVCLGCVTINIEVTDGFIISGPQNNCIDSAGSYYAVVPPTGFTGAFSVTSWTITGMTPTPAIFPSGLGAAVDYLNGTPTFDNGRDAILCAIIDVPCCGPLEICIPIYKCCECPPQLGNACLQIDNTSADDILFDPLISPFITFSSGTYIFTTGFPIYINGTFIIDNNFTFEDCPNLRMGPEAQILIKPGVILTFSSPGLATLVKADCDYMWDGIYFENGPSGIGSLVINPSPITNDVTFRDARNTVVSDFGAPFTIRYAKFENNNTSLIANTFIGVPHPGSVIHSTFEKHATLPMLQYYTPSTTILNPALPRPHVGIELNLVEQIQIGSINAADQNQFTNMDLGIWSKQSWLTAYNNTFNNFHRVYTPCSHSYCPPEGICILAQATFSTAHVHNNPPAKLNIGLTSTLSNTFNNSDIGVSVEGLHSLDIAYNAFTDMLTGVTVLSSAQTFMNINNNVFEKYTRGIEMTKNNLSTINITDNDFNPTNIIMTQSAMAIYVAEPLLSPATSPVVTISGNTITHTPTGILATNLYQADIVGTNDIYYPQNFNSLWQGYGIRVQNNKSSNVIDNVAFRCTSNISNTTPTATCFPGTTPPSNDYKRRLVGISVETSYDTDVDNNAVGYLGTGIKNFNSYLPNTYTCNTMAYCQWMLWLDNSDPGQQGDAITSQSNQWRSDPVLTTFNVQYDVYGPAPTPLNQQWYTTSTLLPDAPQVIVPNFVVILPSAANQNLTCSYPAIIGDNPSDVQQQLADLLRWTRDAECTLTEQGKFLAQLEIYKSLMYNPDLMDLGTADDAYLQEFYADETSTTIGQMANVRILIGEEDYQGAENENSTITAVNQAAANERITNEIYLATWAQDIYTFTQLQYNTLLGIAQQNPISGGPAVYTARVMLGVDYNDFGSTEERLSMQSQSKESFMRIYPNPANSEVNVEYSLGESETGQILLTDLVGREIMKQELNSTESLITVSTKQIENGIYFVCIKLTDETKLVEKLLIAR